MSLYGSGVEYGLHCLLYLVDPSMEGRPSSRDLAEFQGVSPSYVAKLFTALEKAGLVVSAEGVGGGYQLARPAGQITFGDVVTALEGEKELFRCREIRANCVLFDGAPPTWATRGMCGIHAIMREAEQRMHEVFKSYTLADLATSTAPKIPVKYRNKRRDWFDDRQKARRHRGGKSNKKDT